ncbi:protein-export chaperone SecB [uncultured Thiohalocapsa sp.]|uniref:protein-export chaperone SecB n=1 Tax=uncultured Thiohalocapsa sp. TaxID=768990 RepID=UPI0025F4AD39|nr:protein-export chaperone SecB [uncultured Thiohalocapsa sp.]
MAEDTQAQAGAERQFTLRTVYLKDLSFESPNAPEVFQGEWKPETALHMDIQVSQLEAHTHEIVLTITVTAKAGEKTAYLVEVQQAGIVSAQGFEQQDYGPLFYVYCPSILFPYARQAVTDVVAKGGFPQLVLQHINFDAIYAQKLAEQQQGGVDGADQTATPQPTTH